jgi:UDP-N-acetylmuramoyl-L-alanine---L-glutamate ligase
MTIHELSDKKILILGLGREGESSYKLLRQFYPQKRLGLADQNLSTKNNPFWRKILKEDSLVDLQLGDSYLKNILDYQVILKSPGISFNKREIQEAISEELIITSETELFLRQAKEKTIGITGTKGKSTTATLIHHLIKDFLKATLIGNMGIPAFSSWDEISEERLFVYEMSSHQLSRLNISPHIAIFLNLMADHLDYFKDFDDYCAAKNNIAKHQTKDDWLIYNSDDKIISKIAEQSLAQKISFSPSGNEQSFCYWSKDKLKYRSSLIDQAETVLEKENIGQKSLSFQANLLSAVIVSKLMGLSNADIISKSLSYQSPHYRLELIGEYADIVFYNDSAATIPEATISAIKSLDLKIGTLILGGSDKFSNYEELARCILEYKIKNIIVFPVTGLKISSLVREMSKRKNQLDPVIKEVETMEEAINFAYQQTLSGEACLLSPASASFTNFKDYQDRGDSFNTWVRKLAPIYEK